MQSIPFGELCLCIDCNAGPSERGLEVIRIVLRLEVVRADVDEDTSTLVVEEVSNGPLFDVASVLRRAILALEWFNLLRAILSIHRINADAIFQDLCRDDATNDSGQHDEARNFDEVEAATRRFDTHGFGPFVRHQKIPGNMRHRTRAMYARYSSFCLSVRSSNMMRTSCSESAISHTAKFHVVGYARTKPMCVRKYPA